MNCDIEIGRAWAMPNRHTFDIKPIRDLLEEYIGKGKTWIDPFANSSKLATVTNDLSPDFDTDYHLDAIDFLRRFGDSSVDGVLLDPPYSLRQIAECYKGGWDARHERNNAIILARQHQKGDSENR